MADEPVEFVTQKTCILKASIHCEGCKRKVKKILSQVPGVEFVEVDTKQHKVTVTGNVDADSLIKKLIKSGKNAELWPQVSQRRDKITANENKREKEAREMDPPPPPPPSASDNDKVLQGSMKIETPNKKPQGSAAPVKSNGDDAKEINPEEEKKSGESCIAVAEKKEVVEKSTDNGGNGGESVTSGKKKKKKKGQTGNVHRGLENREGGPPSIANQSPPRNHQFPFMPPQPLYAMSYNTAYPASSHTASYFAAPPPHAYAYMHPGHEITPPPPPPMDPELNQRQPLDSFEMFSDENPNGCFIM